MSLEAKTIYQQLGGRHFAIVTGSKNFVAGKNSLTMQLAHNQSNANRLKITLNEGSDLYTMEFYQQVQDRKTSEIKTIEIKKFEDVFSGMMAEIFKDTTGLYTFIF